MDGEFDNLGAGFVSPVVDPVKESGADDSQDEEDRGSSPESQEERAEIAGQAAMDLVLGAFPGARVVETDDVV